MPRLITRRSWVQIPPPLLRESLEIRKFSRVRGHAPTDPWSQYGPVSQSDLDLPSTAERLPGPAPTPTLAFRAAA
jgi:hypothetical protein